MTAKFQNAKCRWVCQRKRKFPDHKRIEGRTYVKDASGHWHSMRLSTFAGGYTREFCKNLMEALDAEL